VTGARPPERFATGRVRWRLTWLLLGVLWGSTWLFIKLGLEDLPPFGFAGLRFLIAIVPLAILVRVYRLRLPTDGADWRLIAVTGLLTFGVDYGLVFWGEQHISSGLTAILFTTFPLFGLVFAHLVLPSEPLRVRKVAGVLLGVAGVAVIYADQLSLADPLAPLGALAVVVGAAAAALASVMLKARGTHLDPTVVTTGQMAFGLGPLIAIALCTEANPLHYHWTPLAATSLLYLALVGSALSFVLWYRLIQVMEVTKAQLVPLFNTVVAVLLGWIVLDEQLGLRGMVGAVAVLGGLALTLTAPRAPTPPAAAGGA
jgi:drug/metabolite transporter (DMT)-like permease